MWSGPEQLTLTGDGRIEHRLREVVGGIVSEIAAALRPLAIFATGSLAKQELTARMADGQVELISDLEIAVVDTNWLQGRRARKLERVLAERWEVDLNLLFFLPRRFTRCAPANWASARSPLSIEQFELLSTAHCLFGQDFRKDAPPVRADDIPVWEGIRLLFNRMAELAGAIHETGIGSVAFAKAVDKLLIACGDALLLAWSNYKPLYRERMLVMARRLESGQAMACGAASADCETILAAYRAKIRGPQAGPNGPAGALATALAISDRVFRYVLGRELGLEINAAAEVRSRYLASPELRRWGRTSARLTNAVGLLKHLGGPLPVPLRRYLGRTYIGHEVYLAVHEWLYCEFRPQWERRGLACLDDEGLIQRGRRHVARWRQVCM